MRVFVILLDAVRRDRMSCYGYRRVTTPYLDQVVNSSVLFLRARSVFSSTGPSVTALMSSRMHDMQFYACNIPAEYETLPRQFSHSYAFLTNPVISVETGWKVHFRDLIECYKATCFDVVDIVCRYDFPEDSFVYIHLSEAHFVYNAYGRERSFLEDAHKDITASDVDIGTAHYDGAILAMDEAIDLILQKTEESDVVVVTSDHGELLGEYGVFGAHPDGSVYDELLNVPLIVSSSELNPGLYGESVTLLDVAPIVLTLCNKSIPDAFEGRNLVSALQANTLSIDLRESLRSLGYL